MAHSDPRARDPRLTPGVLVAGRYRVLRSLGVGGVGEVFEARQERPARRVALKVLRDGVADPAALRRFRFEAQALARMQHPGLAHVYEAGDAGSEAAPLPFLALELVEGEPLDVYARERSIAERVTLVAAVCAAVQHAHERGVLHRDLKPANVLVERGGAPKVVDFGLARAVAGESTGAGDTRAGELVGTWAYMSPEQLAGTPDALDTRCDVYALGVILYELCAGRLPHDPEGLAPAEHARRVATEAPTPLGRLAPACKGDLELVARKALEKEPARRYASAAALAADLERVLAHEPVEARPPSTAYVLRMLARRHRAFCAAAASTLLAVAAGTGLSVSLALAERDARRAAEAAEDAARAGRGEARSARDEAEATLEFLLGVLAAPDPPEPGGDVLVSEALARAERDVDARWNDRPLVEARVRMALARVLRELGFRARAADHAQRALGLRERELGPDHLHTLEAADEVAYGTGGRGDYLGAIARYRALLPPLDAFAEGDVGAQRLALRARFHLAIFLVGVSRYGDAEAIFARWLAPAEALFGAREELVREAEVTRVHALLGLRRVPEALALARSAVARCSEHLGPENPSTLYARVHLIDALGESGDWRAYDAEVADLLALSSRVLGEAHPETLAVLGRHSAGLARQGFVDEALEVRLGLVLDAEEGLGPEARAAVEARILYAEELARAGRAGEALDALEPLQDESLAVPGELRARAFTLRGRLLAQRGEGERALQSHERAVELARGLTDGVASEAGRDLGQALLHLGLALEARGELARAAEHVAQGAAVLAAVLGEGHPSTQAARSALERVRGAQGGAR